MRLLALVLAIGLAVGAAPPARAAAPTNDFIAQMTTPLALNPTDALSSAEREIARTSATSEGGKSARVAAAHWVKAQANFRLGDNGAARTALTSAKRFNPSGDEGRRVGAYVALLEGLLARADGEFGRAITSLRQAQQGFIAAHDDRGHALALQSVGLLYSDVGNGNEALRYFGLAEDTYNGDDIYRLSLNNNFGVALQGLLRFDEAERRILAARRFALRLGLQPLAQQVALNLAANRVFAGELNAADRWLDEFEAASGDMSPNNIREVHRLRALIASRRGQRTKALIQIEAALQGVDPATTDASYWNTHFAAYEIFDKFGLRDSAYVQLRAVRRLEQAETQVTTSNRAALLSAQFQFAAQDAQINRLKADNLEREVSYQRTMTVTIVIGALLALGLLASLLVTAIRARNRARRDSAELSIVNQRLEQALAAKTEFLASTSHELRTPLNGILGMTQILLADADVAPRHRTQIELLHDTGSTMRALVDDILDVAKIEHGGFTINPKPTDVAELAQRVTHLFAAQAANAGLTLDLDVDLKTPTGLVDPDRLTQILFNLIGNALKFTPEGHIHISMVETPPSDADSWPSLTVLVRDSGIGIASEWHDGVFDMFRQVDGARTRNYGGTGLGLAICRQLARAMGGDISLTSAPGEGSTFSVTLPWQAAEIVPSNVVLLDARQSGDHVHNMAAGTVVVVARDPMRTAIMSAMVRHMGLPTASADTGEQIDAAMQSKFLTLLVDASAWPLVRAIADNYVDAQRSIIVVGSRDGEGEMGQADDMIPRIVAFSRNAVAAALAEVYRSKPNSSLPDGAGSGIDHRHEGLEPKRSAPMSRK